jgi:FADH2-dependent halogenase
MLSHALCRSGLGLRVFLAERPSIGNVGVLSAPPLPFWPSDLVLANEWGDNPRVNAPDYDAIVIGGGPGGSCAATVLARGGRSALLLEKERFPRFHVGESLLPYNHALFEEIGVLPALEAAGFPVKMGAQFFLGDGSKRTGFVFGNGRFTRYPTAFQVERAKFDDILLRHAAKSGAEVREEVTVNRVSADAGSVTVDAECATNGPFQVRGRFVIDASGRGNVTGNQERIRITHPKLKKVAVFGHFEGVGIDHDSKGGDTVIVRLENKWFWLIPLRMSDGSRPNKVSIGLVMDRDELAAWKKPPEEVFRAIVDASPPVEERLREAKLVSPIHVTSDFSYRNASFWSPRVVRVGDAAGFIDPIFSSGVFIAMRSGKLAAKEIIRLVKTGGDGSDCFPAYERRLRASMKIYWEMVDYFYTTPFMEVFLEPRPKWDIAAAVNAILAGELEGGWRLRWRMRAFFFLVKWQAKRPFMPKISFGPTARPDAS